MGRVDEDACRRIVALFEMTERAARTDADESIKNEGVNATAALLRLLAEHGLTLGDIPELKRRHAENEAAKKTSTASGTTSKARQPHALELVHHILPDYTDIKPHEYVAVALWALHTFVYDGFLITPRLILTSPFRGHGKTETFACLERLVANPQRHDNVTPAVIYHLIEETESPTLLLDEADNLGFASIPVLRAVCNSGHRRGGTISRYIHGEVKRFPVFTPLALALIGMLPLPLMQRSIVISMEPTARTDIKKLDGDTGRIDKVRQFILAWARAARSFAFDFNPDMPKELHNRIADNWRPLLAIADSFGSKNWSNLARDAAVEFAGRQAEEAAKLALIDIHLVFVTHGIDRIRGAELIAALTEMDGFGHWSSWCGENDDQPAHKLTQGELARMLRLRFKIQSRTVFALGGRKDRGPSGMGYLKNQFEVAWAKYCPRETAAQSAGNIRRLRQK